MAAYCSHCGSKVPHEIGPEERAAREQVEIERIRADKEIAIAKLQRSAIREELETTEVVAEVEAEAEVAAAEAEAEVVGAAMAAGMEPEPEPEPVIIQETAVEPDHEGELPPREEHHHDEPKVPASKRGFF